MGNLGARIKATLLRRDSSRLSAPPSKNSFGQDYASSASTHSQPGYDASDERSDRRVRGSSRSSSVEREQARERTLGRSNLVVHGGSDDDNHNINITSNSHPPAPTPDADASVRTDSPRDQSSQTRPQAADGAEGLTMPAGSGSGLGPDPGLAQVSESPRRNLRQSLHLGRKTGADAAPLKLPDPPPAPNLSAPQILAASSPSHHHPVASATISTAAPTNIAPPVNTTTADTTTANTTNTTGSNTGANAGSNIGTHTSTITSNIARPEAGTETVAGPALPSIHRHPPTPPNLLSSYTGSEARPPPGPLATIVDIEHARDITVNPIDDNLRSPSLLTPPAASPLKPSYSRPLGPPRRQSILPAHQTNFARALLHGHIHELELDDHDQLDPLSGMATRKIWVKRPMASATLITVNEDDLVDDVREQILRKYANSLGRQYDAPDLALRICNREQQTSRLLQPDESISKVIDSYYANGQGVDDALLIDIPSRRTPKASPNPRFYADDRPHESGTDYFPPYQPSAHSHHSVPTALVNGQHSLHFPPSMSIVSGNQLPPLPSPGGGRRSLVNRPNMQRTHTVSPISTIANSHTSQPGPAPTGTHKYIRPGHSRTHSGASSDQSNHLPSAPAIPTPPPVERTATPPPRVSSPRPSIRTKKKRTIEPPSLPSGLLDTAVPPINILIVEDNMINLRLLEAFVKRLKVRWQTAVNGREAVDKWRAGGFHLVLMDIQLPIMNGLDATREIRRIEKVNSIGVFSSSASSPPDEVLPEPAEEDKLANTEMFKSPVIIVALTASSLQSDRHEALAAGCNDFLTKPVNFDWLQRKVKEWGCMQALIDFDGWRKWKDFSQKTQATEAAKKAAVGSKAKPVKKTRPSMTAAA